MIVKYSLLHSEKSRSRWIFRGCFSVEERTEFALFLFVYWIRSFVHCILSVAIVMKLLVSFSYFNRVSSVERTRDRQLLRVDTFHLLITLLVRLFRGICYLRVACNLMSCVEEIECDAQILCSAHLDLLSNLWGIFV